MGGDGRFRPGPPRRVAERWNRSRFRPKANSPPPPGAHRGRYTRGYLPHADFSLLQSITFRLHDSVPAQTILAWRAQIERDPALRTDDERVQEIQDRIARYEDKGHGACWMRRPEIAAIVCRSLLHFDQDRYVLREWCVMPNHVHVLLHFPDETAMGVVVKSWKAFSAKQANRVLGRRGPFWMREYHDRFIRSERHYRFVARYIRWNPVAAGLCQRPEDWPWSSCSRNPGYTRPDLPK